MKISDTVERKLFLKYSASPRDVPKPPNGIEFEFPDPPEFYTIQFVSESPYSEELCKLLLAKLPPILDIALFPAAGKIAPRERVCRDQNFRVGC